MGDFPDLRPSEYRTEQRDDQYHKRDHDQRDDSAYVFDDGLDKIHGMSFL